MFNIPSEYSLTLVRATPHAVKYIDRPSDLLLRYVIDKDPTAIKQVKAEYISLDTLDYLLSLDEKYFRYIHHPTQEQLDYVSWNYENNRELINDEDYRPRDGSIWMAKNYKLILYSPILIILFIVLVFFKAIRRRGRVQE